jgi:transposase-like protein
MPPAMFRPSGKPLSGRYLSFAEREEIALLRVRGCSMREVACRLGRAASTILRELRRNAATRSGGLEYRATTSQWHAERSARRPKQACRTHFRNFSPVQPIFDASSQSLPIARSDRLRAPSTIRTARCRTSGENRFEVFFVMAQGLEPPANPVRFKWLQQELVGSPVWAPREDSQQ